MVNALTEVKDSPTDASSVCSSGSPASRHAQGKRETAQDKTLLCCNSEGRATSRRRHKARKGTFVLDSRKKPLMPCSNKRARLLLERRRARVHKLYPFTIRLVDRTVEESKTQEVQLKIDPGSRVTGIAIVREDSEVLKLAELTHRGHAISEALTQRSAFRRRRRGKLRYRPARFLNRGNKGKGWIAPSLQHRVDTTIAWVERFRCLAPITSLSTELVRFDMQKLENPEISGVEYQQGELAGYEVREYLLEKRGRCCAYCGAKDTPLQIEHVTPKTRGGSNRVSNLTLACAPCNQAKGALPVEIFLAKKPAELAKIKLKLKAPLKDAAAVNATRWKLFNTLKKTGLPVSSGSGGQTKFNRSRLHIPKTHALDAACVGTQEELFHWDMPTMELKATGRGTYKRTRLDKYGFPRAYFMRQKHVRGFKTGDMATVKVPSGKKKGTYFGRVAVSKTGTFTIQTRSGAVQGVSWKHFTLAQRGDGYGYNQRT